MRQSQSLPPLATELGAAGSVVDHSAALVKHMLAGRTASDVGQLLLATVSVFVFWPELPEIVLFGWWGAFLGAAVVRHASRRRLVRQIGDTQRVATALRFDVWLTALLWGALPVLLGGSSDIALALVAIVFAGLIGASASTLVADPEAFYVFMGLLVAPLAAVVALTGLTHTHVALLLMIALYVPFMISSHRRAHALWRDQLDANERLRRSEEEATHRKEFLDALVEYAPTFIVVLDEYGRVRHGNSSFERVMDRPLDEMLGKRVTDFIRDPEVASQCADFLRRLEPGKRLDVELKLVDGEGKSTWMQLTGTKAPGLAAGLSIISGANVTDQVMSRQTLTAAREEAEMAARAKSSFLASMSHEIRTPMNGILGMIELLLDSPLNDEQRGSVEVVQRSADALLRILNDVLDVSKIEAGQLDLEAVGFDLGQVVTETTQVFTAQAWAKSNELALDIEELPQPWVTGDPVRLRQVLSNLLSNAVKFTERGDVILTVHRVDTTDVTGRDQRFRFTVRDTGIGIPLAKQRVVFGEFEQADQSTTRTHGGTGLGLTISRRLVEMMGGELLLDSAVGEGSTFWFEIPLPPAPARAGDRDRKPVDVSGLRFLVVDDNETARRIVRNVLAAKGAKTDEATGVDIGLRQLRWAAERGSPYAAVILDHLMPERDGFDFAAEVSSSPELGSVPMLMLTSSGDTQKRGRARELGIGAYLSKPVAGRDLVRALGELIGHGDYEGPERRLVTEQTLTTSKLSLRILVAEDNPVNQHVAKAMLTKRGHQVDIVANGQLALEAVLSRPYDMVLMDIQMPVMDGHEATRRIREYQQFASLPIIAVTAHAFADERAACEASGMNDFLAKPVKPAELFEALERWAPRSARARSEPAHGESGPAESAPSDEPVDVEAFRAVMRDAGIEEIVEATLELYARETPVVFERIRRAVAVSDAREISAAAHMLKSSSANIRADAFAELLHRLELAGKADDTDTAAALLPEADAAYTAVMSYLQGVSAAG